MIRTERPYLFLTLWPVSFLNSMVIIGRVFKAGSWRTISHDFTFSILDMLPLETPVALCLLPQIKRLCQTRSAYPPTWSEANQDTGRDGHRVTWLE